VLGLVLASSCGPETYQQNQQPWQKLLAQQDARDRAAEAEVKSLADKCKADLAAYDQKKWLHFKSCSDYVRASRSGLEDTVARRQCNDDVRQAQASCREYDRAVNDLKKQLEMEKETDESLLVQP